MTKEQIYEYIEKFINGELTGPELNEFRQKMDTDPDFAQEVELHKNVHSALSNAEKQNLANTLKELNSKYSQRPAIRRSINFRVVASIAAVFLLLISFWMFFLKDSTDSGINDQLITDGTDDPQEIPIDESNNEMNDSKNIAQDPKSPSDDSSDSAQEENKPTFEDNPMFESMIANNGSNESYEINLEPTKLKSSGNDSAPSINLDISGMLKTSNEVLAENVQIQIFSNSIQSLENEKPAFYSDLSLQKEDDDGIAGFGNVDSYSFSQNEQYSLDKGVYYIVIRKGDEGEVLHVEKVIIE